MSKKKDLNWFISRVNTTIKVVNSKSEIPILTEKHVESLYQLHLTNDIDFTSDDELAANIKKLNLKDVIKNCMSESFTHDIDDSTKAVYYTSLGKKRKKSAIKSRIKLVNRLVEVIKTYFEELDINVNINSRGL